MQALILAAGMGRRLGSFTSNNTKCMLEINGVRLIDRILSQIFAYNISKIIIVIGYKGENLKEYIKNKYPNKEFIFIENSDYYKTNNIYSVWLAKDLLVQDDTVLIESDLIFEEKVFSKVINSRFDSCALVSKYESWMDGTVVKLNDKKYIVSFIPKDEFKNEDIANYYKTVNIYKLGKSFSTEFYIPYLDAYINSKGVNEYYEKVLGIITSEGKYSLKAISITGLNWYEIDNEMDYKTAKKIFITDNNIKKNID